MNYICCDRGTDRCPCHLMESGQCYTCTMVSEGCCSCEERAGWQGTCPYSEFTGQREVIRSSPLDQLADFSVLSKISFAPDIAVVRVEASPGLVQQCRRAGTYMMAESLGWRTPLSVLRCGQGSLEFLVKAAGVKTDALLRDEGTAESWRMAGPYYNGLPGSERLTGIPKLTIARGVAAAPLIHMLEGSELPENFISYLDDEGLPEPFVKEYLDGTPYEQISLRKAETQRHLHQLISRKTEEGKLVLLLVSPYYADLLTDGLSKRQQALVIRPNPANLCCGMGICGSCSHTDSEGVTVKLCKCSRAVIE